MSPTNFQPEWTAITVQHDGAITPAAKTERHDRLHVRKRGPMLYRVFNVTKAYVCYVELMKRGRSCFARCDHERCMENVQLKGLVCFHIRRVVKHHVTQKRRALQKARQQQQPAPDTQAWLAAIEDAGERPKALAA